MVRSTGCVINDIFDYKIDRMVERTKDRPLANGDLSLKEAWVLFITLGIFVLVVFCVLVYGEKNQHKYISMMKLNDK